MRHCFLPAKDFLCSAMPSCPEAGQRAKQNRTCHSAQASLRSLLLEESCYKTTEYIRQTGKNWKRLEIPGSLVMMLDSGIFYWEILKRDATVEIRRMRGPWTRVGF